MKRDFLVYFKGLEWSLGQVKALMPTGFVLKSLTPLGQQSVARVHGDPSHWPGTLFGMETDLPTGLAPKHLSGIVH